MKKVILIIAGLVLVFIPDVVFSFFKSHFPNSIELLNNLELAANFLVLAIIFLIAYWTYKKEKEKKRKGARK